MKNIYIAIICGLIVLIGCIVTYYWLISRWRKSLIIGEDILIYSLDLVEPVPFDTSEYDKNRILMNLEKLTQDEKETRMPIKCMIYHITSDDYLYCKDDNLRIFFIKRKTAKLF